MKKRENVADRLCRLKKKSVAELPKMLLLLRIIKVLGYAAQNKYKKATPERYREYNRRARETVYEPKIRLHMSKKAVLQSLLQAEGLSLTQMFTTLVLEKYGIDLAGDDSE